jgi:hypothetical protein
MAFAIEERTLTAPASAPTHTLDDALERLTSAGYQADTDTWERYIDSGLLRHSKGSSAHLTEVSATDLERFRTILDVESRVGARAEVDKLAFFLSASGIPDVPATKVVEYIEAGSAAFFTASNAALHSLTGVPSRIGPDGERTLARRVAGALLGSYALLDKRERLAVERLTEICCTLFLRATWRNRAHGRGPTPRILTPALLDATDTPISNMSSGRPLKSSAAEISLPPAADIARIADDLRHAAYYRAADIAAAAGDAVTVVERGTDLLSEPDVPAPLHFVAPLLAAAFARMRANARPHVCERIAKSALAESEALRSALLTYWS